jgi:hypothetical protein
VSTNGVVPGWLRGSILHYLVFNSVAGRRTSC